MGYWSRHPMGGDTPLDLDSELVDTICGKVKGHSFSRFKGDTSDWRDDGLYVSCKFMDLDRKLARNILKKGFKNSKLEDLEDFEYVLAYLLVSYNLVDFFEKKFNIVLHKSSFVQNDGGGYERGYEEDGADSPMKYMKLLERELIKFKNNEITSNQLIDNCSDEGLLSIIFNHANNGKEGLVNTN